MPQEITVRVGSEIIGRVKLTRQQWTTLRHSVPQGSESGLWVEFRVDPAWRPNRRGRLERGIQTRDLTWF